MALGDSACRYDFGWTKMTIPTEIRPALSSAPPEYDQEWMNKIVDELDLFARLINNEGPVTAKTVRITELPTSSAGLPSGSLWNDSGTVKVA